MSEAKETCNGSSDGLHCSGADGEPRGDGFGVQGTAIIAELKSRVEGFAMKSFFAGKFDVMVTCAIFDNWLDELSGNTATQREGTRPNP